MDNSRHLENYMSHICKNDNNSCNVGTSKSYGKKSHIIDKCSASKYPEVNDVSISNHKNTSEAMNRKAFIEEPYTQKKRYTDVTYATKSK